MTTKSSKGWLPTMALLSLILLAGVTTARAQHHGRHGYGHHGYGHGYSPHYYSGYGSYGYSPYYRYLPGHGLYGYSGYGYSPYGYGSYFQPGYQAQAAGTLKLEVTPKTNAKAQVYVNDALASEFKHKRSLYLAPGEYRIEVRKEGYQSQSRTVRVTDEETLKLEFALEPTAQPSSTEMKPVKSSLPTAEATAAHEPAGPTFLATRLSPSGSKLAIAAWSTGESAGSLRLYDLENGEQLAFDKPSRTYRADEEILALEWAPDEESLVTLTKPADMVAEPPRERVAGLRTLDLQTGGWKIVGTVNLSRGSVKVSLNDTLSLTEKTFLLAWIDTVRL